MKKEKSTDKYIVSQSNSLIEADYSQTNLPAKTMKIGRLIISKISPNDENFRITKIKNSAIRQYLGYKKNVPYNRFNADLEDICRRLNDQVIKILTDKGTIINAFFISSWEIDTKTDETTFEISGRLKEYLLQLKRNYTTYQLKNIPKLNSSYSIRMYELLSQYRRIGKRRFELETLKRKLGCNYKLYGHFKHKALTRSQKELLEFTDIRFDFEEIKKGRKVVDIIFYIYPNNPETNPNQVSLDFLDEAIDVKEKSELSDTIRKELLSIGISNGNIDKYWKKGFDNINDLGTREIAKNRCKTTEMYFVEKLTLLSQSKTTTTNSAGFFIKALKEDWKSPSLFQNQKNTAKRVLHKEAKQQLEQVLKEIEQLKRKRQAEELNVFADLLADKNTFSEAYTVAVQRLGKTYQLNIKGKYDNPKAEYNNSRFVSSGIHMYLKETAADRFQQANLFEAEIKTKQLEVEKLKAQIGK